MPGESNAGQCELSEYQNDLAAYRFGKIKMTDKIVGYPADDFKEERWSERPIINRRNRRVSLSPNKVQTDALGNITDMPLVERLPCFADPVNYLFGLHDRPFIKLDRGGERIESPHGCAGCKALPACHTVADQRLEANVELKRLRMAWHAATDGIHYPDKFKDSSFKPLREAMDATEWTSSNDAALAAHAAKKAADEKKRRQQRNKAKRRARKIPEPVVVALEAERDNRLALLISAQQAPGAPLWLRNIPADRCELTADTWLADEVLARSGQRVNGHVQSTAIADWLRSRGKVPDGIGDRATLTARVSDIRRKRLPKLEDHAGEGEAVWPEFEA